MTYINEEELRHAVGQAGLDSMDLVDTELLDHLTEAHEAITKVVTHMKDRGTPVPLAFGLLLGFVGSTLQIDYKP